MKWARRVHFALSITLSPEPTLSVRPYFALHTIPPPTLADLAPAAPVPPATSIASSEPHELRSASSVTSGTRHDVAVVDGAPGDAPVDVAAGGVAAGGRVAMGIRAGDFVAADHDDDGGPPARDVRPALRHSAGLCRRTLAPTRCVRAMAAAIWA